MIDKLKAKFNSKWQIITASVLIFAASAFIIIGTMPYAITVDGENVCYVRGKSAAEDTIINIVKGYTPKGTKYFEFNTGGRLSYKKVGHGVAMRNVIYDAKEAAQYIMDVYQNDNNPIKVKISSTKTEKVPYTPKPKYVKNKKMLAGKSRVIKKGKKGKRIAKILYTSVNGKVKSKKEIKEVGDTDDSKIVKKGKPATIEKGVLGLPKDKNWKTYKGKPVYKNGREIVITAKNYKGTPYVLGGKSLKNGIDCTHFVKAIYAKYGVDLPASNSGLEHSGVAVPYSKAKKGDIVCYGNHVGIYVGKGRMINAVHKGVKISRVKKERIKTIRRIKK